MRFARATLCGLSAFALLASVATTIAPARAADQTSFNQRLDYYAQLRANFEKGLQALDSNSGSPAALKQWAGSISQQAGEFDADVAVMADEIEAAGEAYKGNVPCGGFQQKLNGPYGRGFGFERLSGQTSDELSSLKNAIAKLDAKQNDLNHAILSGKKLVPGWSNSDMLAATTLALKLLQPRHGELSKTAATMANEVKSLNAIVAGTACQAKPTPSPSPAPKPTPSPTQSPAPSNDRWVGTFTYSVDQNTSLSLFRNGGALLGTWDFSQSRTGRAASLTLSKCQTQASSPINFSAPCEAAGNWDTPSASCKVSGRARMQLTASYDPKYDNLDFTYTFGNVTTAKGGPCPASGDGGATYRMKRK